MRAELLIAIRAARIRLEPKVESRKKKFPLREAFSRFYRPLSPLGYVPLSIPEKTTFFLDAYPRANSKASAVVEELTEAGIERSRIWNPPADGPGVLKKLFWVLYRLPWLISLLLDKRRAFIYHDTLTKQVIVGYCLFRKFLSAYPKLTPIIISDVSPKLHMQWSAAASLNREVFWWQDDYHHIQKLPYRVTLAAVLNQGGVEAVRNRARGAELFMRPQVKIQTLRQIPIEPRVGVATNDNFSASREQIDFLRRLRNVLGTPGLRIRLHPNSKVKRDMLERDWLSVAPSDESLEDFKRSVDLVLVGNSAVQLKLLLDGIPVIHVSGLDSFSFDLYGYNKSGIVYGEAAMEKLSLKGAMDYYSKNKSSERLREYVNVRPTENLPGLNNILAYKAKSSQV